MKSRCISTTHAVTLPVNHSRSHAACQLPMKSRCLSTAHAVTLPFNLSCNHAKRWSVAKVKSRHPTLPVVRQETGQESSSGTEMWLYHHYHHHHHHHHILLYVIFLQTGEHSRLHIKEPKHTHTHTHTHTPVSYTHLTLPTRSLV